MHINRLRIERRDDQSTLILDDLTSGLNVAFDTSAERHRDVRRVVDSLLAGSACPTQATIRITSHEGVCELRGESGGAWRAIDGLTAPNTVGPHHELPVEVVGAVDLAAAFDPHELLDSCDSAALSGAERHERARLEEQLADLERERELVLRRDGHDDAVAAVQRKCEHLGQLLSSKEAELQRLRESERQQQLDRDHRRDELTRELQALEDQRAELQRSVAEAEHRFAAAESRWAELRDRSDTPESRELIERLERLDEQIERWRRVQHDVRDRCEKLRGELVDWATGGSTANGNLQGPPAHIAALERQISNTNAQIREFHRSDRASSSCQCKQLHRECVETLRDMRDRLYTLCEELSRQQYKVRRAEMVNELKQLRRCQGEVKQYLKRLLQRRREWLQRLEAVAPLAVDRFAQAESAFCGCQDHASYLDEQANGDSLAEHRSAAEVVERCRLERDRVGENLRQLLARIDECRVALDRLQVGVSSRAQLDEEIRLLRGRVQAAESQKGHLADQWRRIADDIAAAVARLDQLRVQRIRPALLADANLYLAQMTDGDFVDLRVSTETERLVANSRDGATYVFDALPTAVRDQVRLSMLLAVTLLLERRGAARPLFIFNAFRNLDARQIAITAEVLYRFCEHGRQVVALTCSEGVGAAIARCGAARRSYHLHVAEPAIESPAPIEPVIEPVIEPAVRKQWRTFESNWDAEVFPGELTDRVRAGESIELRARSTVQEASESLIENSLVESSTASPLNFLAGSQEDAFFLSRSDSIDEAPELSPELSAAFKLRGVRTIGDLERVSGADLSEWSEIDLSASQLRYHQSVCLLLCDVRNLRPYDVRILVGAGVDSADQLKSTPSHELLERVEQFIQTTEGRAILVSGDDVELARVANWIRSARESRAFGRRSNRSPQSKQPPQSKPQGLRIASTNERRAEKTTPRGRGAAAKRRSSPSPAPQPSRRSTSSGSGNRKFYLERSSDVEAAPSIGPKMAEHLGKVKVVTVGDLLDDDANTIAERLRQRRVNGETVRQWQSQAEWMCRVPGLRGHDAQILVACGYDSVEQLHGVEPAELFAVVQPVVESKDGRRILRGGKKPDLAEVTDWLQWVQNSRQLQAA